MNRKPKGKTRVEIRQLLARKPTPPLPQLMKQLRHKRGITANICRHTEESDGFGYDVAIFDDTVLVVASTEDGAETLQLFIFQVWRS